MVLSKIAMHEGDEVLQTVNAKPFYKICQAIEYLFLSSFIYFGGTIWANSGFAYDYQGYLRIGAMLFPIAAILLRLFVLPTSVKIPVKCWIWTSAYVLAGCITLLTSSELKKVAVLFAPMALSLLYLSVLGSKSELKKFLNKFVILVTVVAAVSLFFFVVGSTLGLIEPTSTVQFVWDRPRVAKTYFGLYYEPQSIQFFSYSGVRNCAVFAEAPMFAFLLCMALMCEIFLLESHRPRVLILIAAILTTFSTTAWVSLALTGLLWALLHQFKSSAVQRTKKYLSILLAIGFVVSVGALFVDKSDTGSFGVRSDHLLGCIQAFFSHLPFGCGVGNKEAIFEYLEYKQGMSVGLPYFFAELGLIAVIIYLLPLCYAIYKYTYLRKYNLLACLAMLQWVFFITNVETNSMSVWIFVNMLMVYIPFCLSNVVGWDDSPDIEAKQ